MLRSEVKKEDKWKIEDIYENDNLWEEDYKKCLEAAKKECTYRGHLADSEDILLEALNQSDEEDMLIERVYVYAFMKYYEDTSNAVYQEMSGKAQMAMVNLSKKYSFMTPEILAIDECKMKDFLESDKLKMYRHYLQDILSEKEHSLSEKEEKILAMSGQMASAPQEIFSKFNNADIVFDNIKDENGKETELTNGKYSVFMESHNRDVRKNAFTSLYKGYKKYINTIAAMYNSNINQAIFYARVRNYGSSIERYLDGSFIPVSVYENLVDTVNRNLGLMHSYVSLRKKELGVDELHFYDIYAPMVKEFSMKVTYDEAKNIIIDALRPMGEEYLSVVKEGLENGWVDVRESKGKRSGAFSWGTYGVHPYVFLNYSDTLNDVFTLIHEMGHAMHTYYSNKTQPHIYSGYRIFVAEVASTVNEAILIQYLLGKVTDEQERKYLINHYLEQFKGTLFRQTMFAEFEMITHKMAENGEVLSAQSLCKVYKKLNEKYFGEEMFIDEEISYEWARIPHFYTPFYVYQYATGFSAAIAISKGILKGDKNVIEGYKRFLQGGSSLHPIELLKLCGVDMSKPQVIQDALDVFEELLKIY